MELKVSDGKGNISSLLQNNQISNNSGSSQNGDGKHSHWLFLYCIRITSGRTKPTEFKCVFSSSVRFSSIKMGNRRIIPLNTQFVENAE